MSYLIVNIGNHDVKLTTETEINGVRVKSFIPRDHVRTIGEHILKNFDHYHTLLEFPLLEPVLEYLQDHHLLKIVLIGTDQTDKRHSCQDTLFFAQIFKQYLGRRRWSHNSPKVTVLTITDNPADYDNMNVWYGQRMKRLQDEFHMDETVFLALTGGTPAMNAFTLFHGVRFFGVRAEALYLPPGDKRPIPLRIGRDLVVQRAKEELLSLIATSDYYAAHNRVELLSKEIGCSTQCSVLTYLLRYAHARVSFDFSHAISEVDKAIQYALGKPRQELQSLRSELYHTSPADLLVELMDNMRLKTERGEFIDLLSRIFRFQEAAYRLILERLGVQFKSEKKLNLEWLTTQPALQSYLDSYSVEGRKLEYERDVNRCVMDAILRYYAEKNGLELAIEARGHLLGIETLANLRNHTPIAHGFQGVSRETIENLYGKPLDEMMNNMNQLIDFIQGDSIDRVPFFERINQLATQVALEIE